MDRYEVLHETEQVFEWDKWRGKIPYLDFKEEWQVKVIPPFGVGIIRFLIRSGDAEVSVYLDCYDMAGYVREPYWEIYPYKYERDYWQCQRYGLNETDKLIEGIEESIKNQIKKDN